MSTRLVTLRLRSAARLDRTFAVARGVFDGCWLGLTDFEFLHALDAAYYDGEAMYVTESYNVRGLFPWERDLITAEFGGCSRVVVAGAGGGREVLALLDLGFDATGFEPHPKLVAFGEQFLRTRGHPDRLVVADRDRWPQDVKPCDGIVIGWSAYMLIPGETRRIDFLRGARSCLDMGAPLLLSFYPRGRASPYLRTVHRVGSALRRVRRGEALSLGDAFHSNYVHFFTREQISAELAAAGFTLARYEEDSECGRAVAHAV